MASISTDKAGLRRVLFVAPDGKRKPIRLGRVNYREAETVCGHIEHLVTAKLTGRAIEPKTALWLAERPDAFTQKLVKFGLITDRVAKADTTLGQHLDAYFARRTDVKPSTSTNWRHTKRTLLAFFGADRLLTSITPAEARDWERWLKTGEARENRYADTEAEEGLSANTVRKRIGNAKQFFEDAVQRELLSRNPFAKLKGHVGSNRSRDHFVDRDVAAKVLDACPDAQWRLLFALSRYGGLRCPSEHLALRLADIDLAGGKMHVRSEKTEHHEGKESRYVPIFPELRPYLETVWNEAEEGNGYLITRYRDANANLRTQLQRILVKAGVEPWPKLFQNLRASRATELAAEHPAHVAAAWLGHSTTIANKHYWQVTDEDFERATNSAETTIEKAARNPAQQSSAERGNARQGESSAHEKTPVLQGFSEVCQTSPTSSVGDEGLEPPTSTV